jgi:HSP20 family molecular chaperone IbpA
MANSWDLHGDPFEIVDHLHERKHQHNSFLRNLTRRNPNPNTYPNHPDVDISDAITHYIVEVEVPGVKEPTSIQVYWSSWRSLVITGSTPRPLDITEATIAVADIDENINSDANSPAGRIAEARKDERGVNANLVAGAEVPPFLIAGERRIGSFRRDLQFPVGVDMGHIKCKLEAGLLQIEIPKKHEVSFYGTGKVTVGV